MKDGILSIVSDGRIIRTPEEDQQFLQNHVSSAVEPQLQARLKEEVGKQFGEAMSSIDAEIKRITGIEKQAGEKTTLYAQRALTEKQTRGGDPITKERVAQLEALLKESEESNKKALSEYQQKLFDFELNSALTGELEKLNIALPPHLKSDDDKSRFIQQQKALIRQGFLTAYQPKKDENGNIVFYKGDQPQLSMKDGKAKSAGELIGEEYSAWFVPRSHQQTGTGTGAATGAVPAGGFRDKDAIHRHLAASGLDALSKEYQQQFEKLATDNNISI